MSERHEALSQMEGSVMFGKSWENTEEEEDKIRKRRQNKVYLVLRCLSSSWPSMREERLVC